MSAGASESQLLSELDAAHSAAIHAFESKDIEAYRSCFTPGLKYIQADGKTIGRVRLMSDVKAQLDRVHSLGTSYDRKAVCRHSDDRVTETLHQSAWVKVRVFVFFKKHWSIDRSGEYTWQRTAGQWKLDKVVINSESVK